MVGHVAEDHCKSRVGICRRRQRSISKAAAERIALFHVRPMRWPLDPPLGTVGPMGVSDERPFFHSRPPKISFLRQRPREDACVKDRFTCSPKSCDVSVTQLDLVNSWSQM